MFQTYLINTLIFCGILLLLAITVGAVQLALIMFDVRQMEKEARKKFMAVLSVFDVVTLLLGGLGGLKKRIQKNVAPDRSTFVALIAGIKKGLQVFLRKEGE